ncbi:MAG TPA: hypothetical protein GX701_02770, partial [Clostridiales bacterium]|nr:hypothetical protein [Clostridiales bacterium]
MKKYRYACIVSFALLAVLLSACGGATVVKPLEEIRADIEAAVQLPAML